MKENKIKIIKSDGFTRHRIDRSFIKKEKLKSINKTYQVGNSLLIAF